MRTAESVVLTDCPPGPDERNTSIRRSFGSIVDLDVLGLRQHQHAGRAGVDAPLRLGDRHPLHPVDAALPLQPRPDAVAALGHALGLDRQRDVLDAAEVGVLRVEHLGDPAVPLGVPQVHPQQVAGEQRRLLAALAGLDLQDHVLGVVRVARDQQLGEALLERRQASPRSRRPRRRTTGPRRPARGPRSGRRGPAPARRRPCGSGSARRSAGRPGGPCSGRRGSPGRRAASPARRTRRAAPASRSVLMLSPLGDTGHPDSTTAPALGRADGRAPSA